MPSEFDPLVNQVLASENFFRAHQRTELFKYLWQNAPRYSTTKEIWDDVLYEISKSKHKDAPVHDYKNTTRQSCLDLRATLREYFANVTEGWHIVLALGKRNVGYRLELVRLNDPDSDTMTFWRTHVDQENIALVYAQPMCYLDIKTACYLRFLDTNSQTGVPDEAMAEIEKRRPEELQKWYGTTARERLRPAHIFVGIGEMAALDALTTWFQTYPFVSVQKIANESITTLKGISPILIGSPRTNKFIRTLLKSDDGQHLRYRTHEKTIGHVAIKDAQPEEKAALEQFIRTILNSPEGQQLSDFKLYEEKGCTVVPVSPMTLSAVRTRLVILTRMPKPGGSGSVTMISSDTSLAIEQLALALTIDEGQHAEREPQIGRLLKLLRWPKGWLAGSFEALFSVKIAPGGMDDEAEAARLLFASKY